MKVLFVNCCVRGEQSRTLRLCRTALDQISKSCAPVELEECSLMEAGLAPMGRAALEERERCSQAGQFDAPLFRFARQFAQADLIVIGAPYWDFAFPALLKCYLEQICVCGLTFSYDETGRPVSGCQAKRLLYLTTSGGPIGDRNFGFDYLKGLCGGLFGMTDLEFISAEMLDVIGVDVEEQLCKAEAAVRAKVQSWS